jgi:hypothetical protein
VWNFGPLRVFIATRFAAERPAGRTALAAGRDPLFPAREFVVIRLLPPLEFVDPVKNSVDPQSNEFAA